MNNRPFWIVALALSPLACGDVVLTGGTGGGTGNSTSAVTSGGTGGSAGTSFCPAAEPAPGSSCAAPEGQRCTYGEQVRPECRKDFICSNGGWFTTKSVCLSPPADHCAFTEPPTGVCGQEGDVCVVGAATICQCSSCLGGPCMPPPPQWQCSGPPTTPGCPAIVPNDGSACASEGLECTYGNVCSASGALARCKAGMWRWDTQMVCPL
ncbi:MAG: hypothetical protein ABI134_15240 [Byssovorax sp.]